MRRLLTCVDSLSPVGSWGGGARALSTYPNPEADCTEPGPPVYQFIGLMMASTKKNPVAYLTQRVPRCVSSLHQHAFPQTRFNEANPTSFSSIPTVDPSILRAPPHLRAAQRSLVMASPKPTAVLAKLLKCQQIIGYNFRDVSLLQESLSTGKNRRLATAGDTYVQVALVDRWFSISKRTSSDFDIVRKQTVSNHNLAKVGFRRGLDACTLPDALRTSQEGAMADTIEALLGAVYRDALFDDGKRNAEAANWEVFEGVVARLGLNHRLIASTSDLRWSLNPMETTRTLMRQFFSGGHHLELAKLIAETSSKLGSVKLDDSPQSPMRSPRRSLTRTQTKARDVVRQVFSVKRRHPECVPSDHSMKEEKASTDKETQTTSNNSRAKKKKTSQSRPVNSRRELEAQRAEIRRTQKKIKKMRHRQRHKDRLKARKLAASNELPMESHKA